MFYRTLFMYRIPFNQGWDYPQKLWKNLSPRHLRWYFRNVYQRYAYGVSDYDAMDFDEYLLKMLAHVLPQYRNDSSEFHIVRCLDDAEWHTDQEICMPIYDEWLQDKIDTIQAWLDFKYNEERHLTAENYAEWMLQYEELEVRRNNALKALMDELETFSH
jgi:hypothetical protein